MAAKPYLTNAKSQFNWIQLSFPTQNLWFILSLSWRWPLSYKSQSIDLLCKSMDWFLYDNGLRHERVNVRSSHQRWFTKKKLFLKILQYSQENTYVGVSFDKVAGLNTYFKEHLRTAASMTSMRELKGMVTPCLMPKLYLHFLGYNEGTLK